MATSSMEESAKRIALRQRETAENIKTLLETLGYNVATGERSILGRFISILPSDQEAISISLATIEEITELPEDAELTFEGLKIVTAPPGRDPELRTEFTFNDDGEVRIEKPSEAWAIVLQAQ